MLVVVRHRHGRVAVVVAVAVVSVSVVVEGSGRDGGLESRCGGRPQGRGCHGRWVDVELAFVRLERKLKMKKFDLNVYLDKV